MAKRYSKVFGVVWVMDMWSQRSWVQLGCDPITHNTRNRSLTHNGLWLAC